MREWQVFELREIMHALYDGPHATPKISSEGAIFLGIKNVTEDGRLDLSEIRYIAEDDLSKWTKRVTPQKDDIVFSYEATLHRYARISEGFRGCLGRRMALIRPNKKVVDVNFLFNYLLSPLWRNEVERNILTGATVDRIPLTNVPKFKLYLPPLPIQKKIAGILSAYDDLIENNLKRIKLLEEMTQITYEEWFVRLRFPDHESTPINPTTGLPEGWTKKQIQDTGDVVTGKTPSTTNSDFFGKDVPFIKTPDMANAPYVTHSEQFLSKLGADSQKKKYLPKNSLMVSCIGTVGVTALIAIPSQTNQQINSIVFKDQIYAYFMYCFSQRLKPLLQGLGSNGATMTNVNKGKFEAIEFDCPSDELLKKFQASVSSNFDAVLNLQYQNQRLREARDILLPRLMTGVIDVENYDPTQLLKEAA